MLPFQERKRFRKILYSKAVLCVLLVLVVVIGRGAWKIHEKAVIARTERAQTARVTEELGLRSQELEASLARLRSTEGVEEGVRQKYMVARPAEEVVVIVDENVQKSKNGERGEEQSFWTRLWGLWGGE